MYPFEVIMGKLYDKHLRAVLNKPRDKIFILTDGGGLGARVSLRGKIRWQYRYKVERANQRVDLGDYPAVSLVKARELAAECREWFELGYDPKVERAVQKEKSANPITVQDAIEYWLTEYATDNRKNVAKHRAQFERHLFPYIGHLPLEKVTKPQWLACFDRIKKGIPDKQRAAPVAAGQVFQGAKQALIFCRKREYATSHALDDLAITDVGSKQQKRDRVLSEQELQDLIVYINSNISLEYYNDMIWLLIVFGARTQEVRLSTWDEWDFDKTVWTVPKANSKTHEIIKRPIPDAMRAWLLALKAKTQLSGYVLGELKKPEAVSVHGGNLWKKLGHEQKWTLHDLRRTLATRLNDLGLSAYVVDQLLGHTVGGVAGIYNRSHHLKEKAKALDAWLEVIMPINQAAQKALA